MHALKVYIVILNFRKWQDSRDCLESVLRSTYTNFSVFVIDNNSGNNSLEHLSGWLQNKITGEVSLNHTSLAGEPISFGTFSKKEISSSVDLFQLPKIAFIQNDVNTGFAGGNNVVLRILQDQDAYIWLLNPDMSILENTLAELVQFSIRQDINSVVGAVVKYYAGNHKLLFYGGGKVNFLSATVRMVKKAGVASKLDYISGGCLFTHAASIKQLGLLPEEYFLYWEETDWCYRAKKNGYSLVVCPSAICYDKISSVIGKSFLADYYYVRNGMLFISKFRKKNIPGVLLFIVVRFLIRIVTGRWARARGVFKGTIDFFKMKQDEAK
jgi:GT2 family glycosyltransferase